MKPPEAKQWHLWDSEIHRALHTYSRRCMGTHGPQSPPCNYPAPYGTKSMTTQRVHAHTAYSSWTETGRDARHLTLGLKCFLCIHTHLQTQTQMHTINEGRNSSLGSYEEATYGKTGHTNFPNYLASQNSLYALYHPKPTTDSFSLPQCVKGKMKRYILHLITPYFRN